MVAEGADLLTLEAPEGIQQLIAQQFERLAPGEQELLEAASVAGKEFAAEVVAACLDADAEVVESQCAALARRGQFFAGVWRGANARWRRMGQLPVFARPVS